MKRITLRQATGEDWPQIQRLHQEHQAAQGTDYELPWLFGSAIAIALVGVDESGTIRNCIYVEKIAELRFAHAPRPFSSGSSFCAPGSEPKASSATTASFSAKMASRSRTCRSRGSDGARR